MESLQAELAHIRTDWAKERERREAAEAEALRLQGHQQALDQVMEQLRKDAAVRVSSDEKKRS